MPSKFTRAVGLVLALAAVCLSTPHEAPAQNGTITGVVSDEATDLTLGEVAIRIESLERTVYSNATGRFNLLAIPAGQHTLTTDDLGTAPTPSAWMFLRVRW